MLRLIIIQPSLYLSPDAGPVKRVVGKSCQKVRREKAIKGLSK